MGPMKTLLDEGSMITDHDAIGRPVVIGTMWGEPVAFTLVDTPTGAIWIETDSPAAQEALAA